MKTSDDTERLSRELLRIRASMVAEEARLGPALAEGSREPLSLGNLVHYLALRRHDLRSLQPDLERLGLSTLGRAEAHALSSVDAVLGALRRLGSRDAAPLPSARAPTFDQGRALLFAHGEAVLGPPRRSRSVRIMVTLASEASRDYLLVRELLASGMDLARINCAHDDASAWSGMIENIERARRELSKPCRVMMDLAGPKLRTGAIAPGPRVVKFGPRRDVEGHVLAPARVLLSANDARPGTAVDADAVLTVARAWLSGLRPGDRVELEDLRGKARELRVIAAVGPSFLAESMETSYVGPESQLRIANGSRASTTGVLDVPAIRQKLLLRPGDHLILTESAEPGRPATVGERANAARIGCTLPSVFEHVRAGHRVWFDDGKIGGVVVASGLDEVDVRITQAGAAGSSLGADKGINLPDTELGLPFLDDKDREDLRFVARHASVAGLSYVQRSDDLLELSRELVALGSPELALVLKIETRHAFEHLPELLLTSLGKWPTGVMIARGDLAIEIGWERLAEVQEEILWICEAAHVPVVWATAVLETLAKKGTPSRAEITDAAMSQRAECVMLNKGPYVIEAIRVLDDILKRMEAHQRKKTSFLRPLKVSNNLG